MREVFVCPSDSLALTARGLSLKQIHSPLYTISLMYLLCPGVLSLVGELFLGYGWGSSNSI